MSIIVLITARMKSTRLPRKTLLNFQGKSLIEYQIQRLKSLDDTKLIICTSWLSQDDPIEILAKTIGLECFRGDPVDVLSRYYNCASKYNFNEFLITYSDEPFLDLQMVRQSFKLILKAKSALWIDNSNSIDGTFCYGLNKDALNIMINNKKSVDTEVWGTLANKLQIPKACVKQDFNVNKDNIRLTIDYNEDYEVFKKLAKKFLRTASIQI